MNPLDEEYGEIKHDLIELVQELEQKKRLKKMKKMMKPKVNKKIIK